MLDLYCPHQRAMLPSRDTSSGWRNGLTATSPFLRGGHAESWTWDMFLCLSLSAFFSKKCLQLTSASKPKPCSCAFPPHTKPQARRLLLGMLLWLLQVDPHELLQWGHNRHRDISAGCSWVARLRKQDVVPHRVGKCLLPLRVTADTQRPPGWPLGWELHTLMYGCSCSHSQALLSSSASSFHMPRSLDLPVFLKS